eukprot:GCRY01003228.1.p1 GENE.GCRY01003228.1~~GCRY01003228.1.p1  ORF type:complete len:541 (+),score=87.93 GCRY01003228.1:86-1708(+)
MALRYIENCFPDHQPLEWVTQFCDLFQNTWKSLLDSFVHYPSHFFLTEKASFYVGDVGVAFGLISIGENEFNEELQQRISSCLRDYLDGKIRVSSRVGYDREPWGFALCFAYSCCHFPKHSSIYLNQLIDCFPAAMRCGDDELLYGKAGYLQGLLFSAETLLFSQGGASLPSGQHYFRKILRCTFSLFKELIRVGAESADRVGPPLWYTWHGKGYLGGAHGLGGILLTLLQFRLLIVRCNAVFSGPVDAIIPPPTTSPFTGGNAVPGPLHSPPMAMVPPPILAPNAPSLLLRPGKQEEKEKTVSLLATLTGELSAADSLIRESLVWLAGQVQADGSINTKFPSESLKYICQWCHGPPGVMRALALGEATYGQIVCQDSLRRCAAYVWKKGLLRKGCGLCHGVSGNAFALLAAAPFCPQPRDVFMQALAMSAVCSADVERWLASLSPQPAFHFTPFLLQSKDKTARFPEEESSFASVVRAAEAVAAQQQRRPDHPWSLFEGRSGTLVLLTALRSSLEQIQKCPSRLREVLVEHFVFQYRPW